jgi:uncharacterized protein involved in outer membrane biogenesis
MSRKVKTFFNSLALRNWPAPCRKWSLRIAVALVLYTLVGFFVLPPIIRSQLAKQLAAATHRQAAVRQVRLNPWALSLTVRGLELTETNGAPFASFEEFYANFQLSSLFRWAWTFDKIFLKEPRAELILDPQGRFNFANLFQGTNTSAPPKAAQEKAGVPRLLVFTLTVTNGHLGFADLTHKNPFRTAYEPINFNLNRFTTKPDRRSPYTFDASSDTGRGISWAGTVTAQPPGSSGTLRINGVQLPKHSPYLENYTRAQLTDGTLDLGGDYFFALGTNGLDLVVSNFAATVSALKVKDPDTGETVFSMSSYKVRDAGLDWRTKNARIGSIAITDPELLVRRRSDASINLVSLIVPQPSTKAPETNAAAAEPWEFTLKDCRLEGGSVQFEDETVPGSFRSLLKPLSLRLENFTTRRDSDAALRVGFTTDAAEKVDLAATCSIASKRGAGTLQVAAVDLKRYQAYLAPFFKGQLASGKAELALDFSASQPGDIPDAAVSNLVLRVSDLNVKSPGGEEEVATIASFLVNKASARLAEKTIHVESIELEKATASGRREKDGTINLLALLASGTNAAPVAADAPAEPESPGWQATVSKVALRDCAVRVEDRQLPRPGLLQVDQLSVSLDGIQFPSNAPIQTAVSCRVNTTGTASVRGQVWPYTPALDTTVEVAGLDLRAFQPWVDTQAKLGIVSGALRTRGRVKFGSAETGAMPALHFEGEFGVTNLATQDQVLFKEFVRWDDLSVTGIDADLRPNRANVEQVRFAGLRTSVIIGPDKRPNFILPASGQTTNVPASSSAPAEGTNGVPATEAFPVKLKTLALENASFHFGDESVQPACSFDIKQFGGVIEGLSSEPGAVSTVSLTGTIDESSPFGLHGTLNPLARDPAFDLTFTNRSLQLTPFTPYMEKFAGHPLNKGRLSLDLAYAVQQGRLTASNSIRIDQLMLGQRNNSPDATKLPVKLAVALLKDRNGQIALDVPVEGRLDDPEFSVGPIILKVIVNLIAKAATSPFKLLGSLVGGGEELSYLEFAPGDANLLATETNKIEKLGKALAERPALNLEIEASADSKLDRDAMARRMVRDQIRLARVQEVAAVGQPADASGFQVEPEQFERLLRAEVVKQFGSNLTNALQEFAARASATNQVPAENEVKTVKVGLVDRALAWLPLQKKNSPGAVARRQMIADAALLKENPAVGALSAETMEMLLASRTEVPLDAFLKLMQARAATVQGELLKQQGITAERLFLMAPKALDPAQAGQARVNLSLN